VKEQAFFFRKNKWVSFSVVVALVIATWALPATAKTMEELAAEAEKAGPVIWYESSKRDQAAKIIEAFNKRFPKVELKHLRITGGVMAGKIIQESQTGQKTADVGSTGAGSVFNMTQRELLKDVDWPSVGIDKRLIRGSAVVTAASLYVALYNTKLVGEAEAPRSWEDLLNSKWKNKIGTWIVAGAFAQLAKQWGEEKVTDYIKKFNQQKPFLFRSTFPLAQQVAAGEIPVALGIYHTAQPPIRAGAPLKVVVLDPTPVSSILSFVTKPSTNPAGAELLIRWLCSPDGGKAYEDVTYRGNHLIQGTATAKQLQGIQTSEFPMEEMKLARRLMTEYNEMIRSEGVKKQ
jgi:ABC-type Fe3+ transport system substrate-binding protein